MNIIKVKHIHFKKGSVDFELACDFDNRKVSPKLAKLILDYVPSIGEQICVNDKSEYFKDEIVGTELAHLVEHLLIEIQGSVYKNHVFKGHTSWADEIANTKAHGYTLMTTNVDYLESKIVVHALKEAIYIVTSIYNGKSLRPFSDIINDLQDLSKFN
ncbi:MAG: hypothetical protein MJ189_04820 [Coriobacteriales bacterium]|nr:hypothetical protein [Coriobacteriales bacterium]